MGLCSFSGQIEGESSKQQNRAKQKHLEGNVLFAKYPTVLAENTHISLELCAVPGLGPGRGEPQVQGELQDALFQLGEPTGWCRLVGVASLTQQVLQGFRDEPNQTQGRVELQQMDIFWGWAWRREEMT